MESAPFFNDVALGPDDVRACWLTAKDGVRLRGAVWPNGAKGTVLLFNGRTEYLEKYGMAAADFNARGYAVATMDWRGQGLSDRLLSDRVVGHVNKFADFQMDVTCLLDMAKAEGLPKPYYLVAHSMGGAIGLRALFDGLDVNAVTFSAPMFGVLIAPALRPFAWGLSWVAKNIGMGDRFAPGTSATSYVLESPFDDNTLTDDPEIFAYLANQLKAHPDLALGGPGMHWLNEALIESRRNAAQAAPNYPALCFLGGNERIVDVDAIQARMAGWRDGRLEVIADAEHEIMMELPERRKRFFDETTAFFAQHV